MLLMASWYHNPNRETETEPSFSNSLEDGGIYINYISLFLVLFIVDTPTVTSTASRSNYDAIWPVTPLDRDEPAATASTHATSSSSSASQPSSIPSPRPSTPVKLNAAAVPLSPRSPKTIAPSVTPHSPKRISSPSPSSAASASTNIHHYHGTPHQGRNAAQHLFSLKQKLPLLLKVISLDEDILNGESDSPVPLNEGSGKGNDADGAKTQEFLISKSALDSLGFIVCAGRSHAVEDTLPLSSMHPTWAAMSAGRRKSDDMSQLQASDSSSSSTSSPSPAFHIKIPTENAVYYSSMLEWLNEHLTTNDLLYPAVGATNGLSTTASRVPHVTLSGQTILRGGSVHVGKDEISSGFRRSSSLDDLSTLSRNQQQQQQSHIQQQQQQQLKMLGRLPCKLIKQGSSILPHHFTIIRNFSSTILLSVVEDSPGGASQSSQHTTTTALSEGQGRPEYNLQSPDNVQQTSSQSSAPSLPRDSSPSAASKGVELSGQPALFPASTSQSVSFESASSSSLQQQPLPPSTDPAVLAGDAAGDGNTNGAVAETKDERLPHCCISSATNATLYLLAPFASVTLNMCVDCRIVIGAVSGAIIVHSCQGLVVTAACKKLIAVNSSHCTFHVASVSPSVTSGDCHNLIFGAYTII